MDSIADSYGVGLSKISELICDVCQESASKYRCPGCERATCSLRCCQSHKERDGCAGRRDRAAFVRRSDYGLPQLSSDIGLLEDAARIALGARKLMKSADPMDHKEVLVQEANRRGVDLRLLAEWFPKRKENQTYYHGRKMFWSVRWIVRTGDDQMEIDILKHRCMDFLALTELAKSLPASKGLSDEQRQQLAAALADPSLEARFTLQQDPAYTAPRFLSLPVDGQRKLRHVLAGKLVVEYPTIHLRFLPRIPLASQDTAASSSDVPVSQ